MKTPNDLKATSSYTHEEFEELAAPYHRELLVHCYRILGSLLDAEDALQETLLKAWRRLETFKDPSSFRAWLYKIATNVCFDLLKKHKRRSLPTHSYPQANPQDPLGPPPTDAAWLEPFPDTQLPIAGDGLEEQVISQENVALAFIAALQLLTPPQRAALILRDVLGFRASETAQVLDLSVSSVNSLLHRARVNISKEDKAQASYSLPQDDVSTQQLLDQYQHAWETADISGLVALIKEDATFEMPPLSVWYQSRDAILQFMEINIFSHIVSGDIQFRSLRANGNPAFAVYERNQKGEFVASGIQVIHVDSDTARIRNIVSFRNPELVPRFGLPKVI